MTTAPTTLPPFPGMTSEMIDFCHQIRFFLRDHAALNRLIKGEEHSFRMVAWAVLDAVDDFNQAPPLIGYDFASIPKSVLRNKVVATLLESLALLDLRNALTYTDAGTTVSLEKYGPLQQMAGYFRSTYENARDKHKIATNIAQGFGSISSPYVNLVSFFGGP